MASGERAQTSVASQFFSGAEDAAIDMTTSEKVPQGPVLIRALR